MMMKGLSGWVVQMDMCQDINRSERFVVAIRVNLETS